APDEGYRLRQGLSLRSRYARRLQRAGLLPGWSAPAGILPPGRARLRARDPQAPRLLGEAQGAVRRGGMTGPMPSGVPAFDRFVALDWSGARGPRYRGVAVAECGSGGGPPRLVRPSAPGPWTRMAAARWLLDALDEGGTVL